MTKENDGKGISIQDIRALKANFGEMNIDPVAEADWAVVQWDQVKQGTQQMEQGVQPKRIEGGSAPDEPAV